MIARLNALAAIAFVCLSSTAPVTAQDRVPVTARVKYADLDLASAAGMKTLKNRIARSAMAVCQSPAFGLAGVADAARCRREMTEDGMTQIAQRMSGDVQVATAR